MQFIKSVWFGFLSIFEPEPPKYRTMSVEDALRSDWQKVGQDMQRAIDKFDQSH